MKKVFLFLLIIIVFGSIFFSRTDTFNELKLSYVYDSKCADPLYYKIGFIDPRFGLTKDEVINTSGVAADIWNNASGKKIYEYNPEAILTINMVYDQRQFLNTQINQLEDNLDSGKTTLEAEKEKFNASSSEFNRRNKEFKKKVFDWNTKSDRTQEELDILLREQENLNNEADKLNETASRLNITTSEFNNNVSKFNKTVGELEEALVERPEEGIYDPSNKQISIYFNNNEDELVRTIAHELGHARGLGHIDDKTAIMYPMTTDKLKPIDEELEKLNEICEVFPIYELYIKNIKNNLRIISASIN